MAAVAEQARSEGLARRRLAAAEGLDRPALAALRRVALAARPEIPEVLLAVLALVGR